VEKLVNRDLIEELDVKISAIIQFLHQHQKADGEYEGLRYFAGEVESYVTKTEYENWWYFGKCPFFTATVLCHLEKIDHVLAIEIKKKGCDYLLKGLENGLVRYVAAYDRRIDFPTDIDDTALIFKVLNLNGYEISANNSILFNNANEDGDLFTWVVPRKNHLKDLRGFSWILKDYLTWNLNMLSYGTSIAKMRELWKEYQSGLDTSAAINFLLYTGVNQNTQKYLNTIFDRLENEGANLEYYDNLIVPYFHLARLYDSGADQVIRLKEKIVSYIKEKQRPDGEIDTPLFSAIACLTLIYFKCWDEPVFQKLIAYLMNHDMHETGWKPLHYCNQYPSTFLDGSAGTTAVFYLDALYRYREHLQNK
jgi:hypothetical protein